MLKYSLIAAISGFTFFSFSSCVQSYDCECITTEDGVEVFRATDTYAGTKKSTEKICADFEENQNKIGKAPGRHTNCTIK